MQNKLLSVVVPVYKVEKYINKCLDSLIVSDEQMNLLEVIVVNDGTPDNSAIMAKEYERKYPNTFRVIDKENGGHGSAWNRGVQEATGKYLRFLDSDDWLSNLSEFMYKIESCNSDFILTDVHCYHEDTNKSDFFRNTKLSPMKEYNTNTFNWQSVRPLYRGSNYTNFHACTYKTSLLKAHSPLFLEKIFYDDEILMVMPLCVSETFTYVNQVLYNYLLGREGQSVNNKVRGKNLGFLVKSEKAMIDFYHSHPVKSQTKDKELCYILNYRIKMLIVELFLLPYQECKLMMKDFIYFIHEKFSRYDGGILYKAYKFSYPICWLIYHYLRPMWAYFKINILKK